VAGEFGLRFYAGVPQRTEDGYNLGTLCVLDTKPREVTQDEVAVLEDLAALVMDQMELRLQSREVLRAEAALRRDAERLADALQASLLPPTPPTVPGMDVAAEFVAGEQGLAIGGDFLDVFRLGPNDWAMVLGDVCGKGARAAALTGLTRWTVRAAAVHQFQPTAVLRDLNTTLLDHGDDDDHFCTAVFGRLELDVCGAWVTLATSGHPQPILVRASGLVERRGVPSLPLGMFEEIDPVDDRVGLGPADCLVFYTDGIIEAKGAGGERFGTDRLVGVLRAGIGSSAAELARAVVAAAQEFSAGEIEDDVAVLVIRVPEGARDAGIDRVVAASGIEETELTLPGYEHGTPPPPGADTAL
jgi:sigma-B regulation protein RsbU (phosphoserine phosphatase)